MTTLHPTRRQALAAGAAAVLAPGLAPSAGAPHATSSRHRRALRIAHITDIHINGDKGSDLALARCLAHVRDPQREVDLIINTGDTVMDLNGATLDSARAQWKAYHAATKDHAGIDILHTLGNHDWFRWEPPTADNPLGGRQMTVDQLGMPGRYYAVDRNGWRFIILDDIVPGYRGEIDPEQREWLADQLQRTPATTPVCIATHIPVITACGFFDGQRFADGQWTIPGSWMHADAAWCKDLFLQHPQVKLCLSGHMHQVDRVDFQNVSYICSGAVSASWWGGKYYQCDYGYSLIDLFDDGSFQQQYVAYGWPDP